MLSSLKLVGSGIVEQYRQALALLSEASDLMEAAGDTLIAAHIATPLAMVEDRLSVDTTTYRTPSR